jgi:uncharacterized protein YndB with AHSA1/START domain
MMKDVLDELSAVRRTMGAATLPAGDAYTMELTRRYDADLDDVWDALTDPERLARWMKPVTGDLRPGGSFALDGGEHGEILRCEPPHLLRVSWMFGPGADEWPGTSEVEVRLTPGAAGDTELALVHAAVLAEPMFPTYGPGAGGVGWDLRLLTLAGFLGGGDVLDHEAFEGSPAGRDVVRRSAASWGEAHLAGGGDPDHVAAAVEATTAFYLSADEAR